MDQMIWSDLMIWSFGNHFGNQAKKMNQVSIKSKFQNQNKMLLWEDFYDLTFWKIKMNHSHVWWRVRKGLLNHIKIDHTHWLAMMKVISCVVYLTQNSSNFFFHKDVTCKSNNRVPIKRAIELLVHFFLNNWYSN